LFLLRGGLPVLGTEVSSALQAYERRSNSIFIACFNVKSGDIEDAPAPAALNTFELVEKDGAVYIRGEESAIKSGQRLSEHKCSATGSGGLVIVGG
jgi:hypothetical protein